MVVHVSNDGLKGDIANPSKYRVNIAQKWSGKVKRCHPCYIGVFGFEKAVGEFLLLRMLLQ